MASRYDTLDATAQLEQAIAADLLAALGPRGCEVAHNGSPTNAAPGGIEDITVTDRRNRRLLLVEVTKRHGAAADGEFAAITDHLDSAVAKGGFKDYGLLYVSPRTSARMALNIIDRHNRLRAAQRKKGRIVAVDFSTLEDAIDRWRASDPALYPASRLGDLFERWEESIDDARTRQLVASVLFAEDLKLVENARERLREHDTAKEQELRRAIEKLENQLREHGVTGVDANKTLIVLTFIRLYEEKRQRDRGEDNRFTREGFTRWCESLTAKVKRDYRNRLVQYLVEEIAEDPALIEAQLLRAPTGKPELLHRNVNDVFVTKNVLDAVLDKYTFYGSEIDVLGVVFETLARRGEKDTRVGQFFTPQEVVNFCAQILRLRPTDRVLDPAVGTARFLIAAMVRMLNDATSDAQRSSIRTRQLFGTDIDDWIVTIAKMNMYIHGDGKTTIAGANGLTLGDLSPFGEHFKKGVAGRIDAVLTNPPLGEASYLVARDKWAEGRTVSAAEEEAFFRSLGVVPMEAVHSPARRQFESAQARLLKWEDRLSAAADTKQRKRAVRYRDKAVEDLRVTSLAMATDPPPMQVVKGTRRKGGALFTGAIASYLRKDRLPEAGIEWQGGRCATVIDEAVLNTPEYEDVRCFIRSRFFVKAVVSLGRQAFKYLAHTDAKTSVLYLVRKPYDDLAQREPIFFAHAERCGYSSVGKWIGSDLPAIRFQYDAFEKAVLSAYVGARFDTKACVRAISALKWYGERWHLRFVDHADPGARLDFFSARYDDIVKRLKAEGVRLTTIGALMQPRDVQRPFAATDDAYEFATINRNLASVLPKGRITTTYEPTSLWLIEENDIVVSGIDLIHGAVAVAGRDVAGLVMSNEMFPYRATDQVLPEYLAMLLRADVAKTLIHGRVTGTSNRTRVTDPAQILDIPIPLPPSIPEQKLIVSAAKNARQRRTEAEKKASECEATVAAAWKIAVAGTPDEVEEAEEETA